ncbi:MAG: hypothetical protein ACQEQO_11460 [Thermodesulfobacteriota bacterium]
MKETMCKGITINPRHSYIAVPIRDLSIASAMVFYYKKSHIREKSNDTTLSACIRLSRIQRKILETNGIPI